MSFLKYKKVEKEEEYNPFMESLIYDMRESPFDWNDDGSGYRISNKFDEGRNISILFDKDKKGEMRIWDREENISRTIEISEYYVEKIKKIYYSDVEVMNKFTEHFFPDYYKSKNKSDIIKEVLNGEENE